VSGYARGSAYDARAASSYYLLTGRWSRLYLPTLLDPSRPSVLGHRFLTYDQALREPQFSRRLLAQCAGGPSVGKTSLGRFCGGAR